VNPDLFAHLSAVRAGRARGITIVRIAGDAGRMFLWKQLVPGATRVPIRTRDAREAAGAGVPSVMLGTTQGEIVLERSFPAPALPEVAPAATPGAPRIWLVTSVEGLAPDDVDDMLGKLLERVCSDRLDHAVVLGLPETFPATSGDTCAAPGVDARDFDVVFPMFRSRADVGVRQRDGTRNAVQAHEEVPHLLTSQPWLRMSLGNSLVSEVVLSVARRPPEGSSSFVRTRLEEAVLGSVLARYADFHARPRSGSEMTAFRGALGAVAAHYSHLVEGDGTFTVKPADTVRPRRVAAPALHVPPADDSLRRAVTPVDAVLRNSRVARLVARREGASWYRFEPAWAQRVLATSPDRLMFLVEPQ
jgi:hypothetical protein